jgi:glycerol-3-phosphate dehydrogenase
MWSANWRDKIWAQFDRPWDLLIIGGGITGAGILREAARLGLRALLVEQRDFAWGTSSRSSKLVHGGLRYLATGQLGLTWASVREREQLLQDGPGLIEPIGFLLTTYKGDHPGRWAYAAGLSVYDLMAWRWSHRHYSADELHMLAPYIVQDQLGGGFRYEDAQTDDVRLTLRVIREGVAGGGVAINYVKAQELLHEAGEVIGARLRDEVTGRAADVRARVVINATGAWADHLRHQAGAEPAMRPLRGSHLIFSSWRLPLAQAISFLHPDDHRPVFAFPWEGVTLVGTTDLDHDAPLDAEPSISPEEVAYLMAAVEHQFPSRSLTLDDVIATLAGVRPVIGSGKDDPSKESREHVIWQENGLLTVTGGKLTTFRRIALDVLKVLREHLPDMPPLHDKQPVFAPVEVNLPQSVPLNQAMRRRLIGRYGVDVLKLVAAAQPGELTLIPGTPLLWAELRWAARDEGVVHLDDLLLRRVRVGLLLRRGGEDLLPRIRSICQPELGWDDARWDAETAAYRELWRAHYSLPDRATIPDWRTPLREIPAGTPEKPHVLQWSGLFAAVLLLVVWLVRRWGSVPG